LRAPPDHTQVVASLQMHGTGTALGDPIEVGAATAVLLGAAATPARRLTLAADKTSLGHAEPAAGALGLGAALASLQQRGCQPVLHLRRVNAHVAALMDSLAEAGEAVHMPRQRLGRVGGSADAATGQSAFAFQGTNAHAAYAPPSAASEQDGGHSDINMVWTRGQRHHFAVLPPLHAMVRSIAGVGGAVARFDAVLGRPPFSFFLEHRVAGRPLLPGSAFLEMATVGARQLLMPGLSTTCCIPWQRHGEMCMDRQAKFQRLFGARPDRRPPSQEAQRDLACAAGFACLSTSVYPKASRSRGLLALPAGAGAALVGLAGAVIGSPLILPGTSAGKPEAGGSSGRALSLTLDGVAGTALLQSAESGAAAHLQSRVFSAAGHSTAVKPQPCRAVPSRALLSEAGGGHEGVLASAVICVQGCCLAGHIIHPAVLDAALHLSGAVPGRATIAQARLIHKS
jgi:Beta-ketoacyl synthase, C-terminal domain